MRAGDAEALREVVDAYGARITTLVAGVLKDRDAVDDAVQETFVKAFLRIGSFRGGSALYTWLYRVALNTARDHAKARRRRPALSLEETEAGAPLRARDRPPVESLEDRETRLAVRAAVEALPSPFREVLVLREVAGLSYDEISEALGISLGTVESRLFRARQRLARALGCEDRDA